MHPEPYFCEIIKLELFCLEKSVLTIFFPNAESNSSFSHQIPGSHSPCRKSLLKDITGRNVYLHWRRSLEMDHAWRAILL